MKKVLSIILSVLMVVSMIPLWSVAVSAEDHVHVDADKDNYCDDSFCDKELYIDRNYDATTGKIVETLKEIPADAIPIEAYTTDLLPGKTYVVSGNITIWSTLCIQYTGTPATTVLILKDGCQLNVESAIQVYAHMTLVICGQAKDGGVLNSKGTWSSAILADDDGSGVTINGGTVNAYASEWGAGIGRLNDSDRFGPTTINGGFVSAQGGQNLPGIGSMNTAGKLIVNGDCVIKAGHEASTATETTVEAYKTSPSRYVYIHVHNYSTSYVDNEDGTHTAACACGAKLTEEHTFENGVCVCGAKAPVSHEHVFASEWTSDETAHWHVCTAEDCDIEDYATCGLEGAAYAAHVYDQEVVADRYLKSEAIYTRGGIYYMSCKCGACDKSENAATFTDYENRSLSECYRYEVTETGSRIGRQGKINENGYTSSSVGRTIIPLTAEQLGEIGDCLTILANDGNGDFTLTIDCVYTYFYDVTDGTETKYEAGQGDLADFAAFIILDKKSNDSPLTGYGYFRVYNGSADETNFLFDALIAPRKPL